jgi:hypothetical protein
MGYFPCAPIRPTLAVDINLLEFVTIGSHNMAPNVKGWSDTLQSFLAVCSFLLGGKVRDHDIQATRVRCSIQSGCITTALWECATLVPVPDCDSELRGRRVDTKLDIYGLHIHPREFPGDR